MTTRMIILEALQSGPKSPKDIAKITGKAYSTVCGAIEVLEAKGLIQEHSTRAAKTKPETLFAIKCVLCGKVNPADIHTCTPKEQNNGMA